MLLKGKVLQVASRWQYRRSLSSDLKAVVGLEVHVQIASKSKLFSSAPTSAGPANDQVALFDAAIPGTLPVLNRRCVEAAVQTAIALQCSEINKITRFDRKHYFYADMPAGFQITQQFHPIARNGKHTFFMDHNSKSGPIEKSCRIHQIQLEQDSGKSIHDGEVNSSLIDLNRAGVGLLEIVFEPDLSNGIEASSLVKDLIAILKSLGVSSGKMEEGALRVDANVSVHKPGTPLGVRTEIKNLNSLRSVRQGVEFEIKRQIKSVESGIPVTNVTMSFDTETDETVVMRDKEMIQDYRFFPEPNIPVVNLDQVGICIETIREQLPPLPVELRKKLTDVYGLDYPSAVTIVRENGFLDLFLKTVELTKKEYAKRIASLMLIEILDYLNTTSLSLHQTKLTPENMAEVVDIVETRKANYSKCIQLLKQTLADGSSPREILKEKNWYLVDDVNLLSGLCDEAIGLYPKECGKILRGKERPMSKLCNHVLLATDGRADTKLVKKMILEKLQGSNAIREEIQIGR